MDDLLAAIAADPDGVEPYLVYADWLTSQGHPRGELISVQHALSNDPDNPELRARQSRLLEEHAELLLGEGVPPSPSWDPFLELDWHLGFVSGIRMRTHLGPAEDERPARPGGPAHLGKLINHASAQFLRELCVEAYGDGRRTDWELTIQPATDILTQVPRLTLRRLELGFIHTTLYDQRPVYAHLGDITGLYLACPTLERLVLTGEFAAFGGALRLPHLRALHLRIVTRFGAAGLNALLASPLAELETLELWLGAARLSAANLAPLFTRDLFPRLKHLKLLNTEMTDELTLTLAASNLLPQLESLDLSFGTMTDEGAERIAANRVKFEHLRTFGVQENYLTDRGLERIDDVCENVASGHQDIPLIHRGEPLRRSALIPNRLGTDAYNLYGVYARETRAFEAKQAGLFDTARLHYESALLVARTVGHYKVDALFEELNNLR